MGASDHLAGRACSPAIFRAIEFSAKAHLAQLRKGTDIPYITHPFAVGLILAKANCTEDVIIAGILHDTIEDTGVALSEIRELFGDAVAEIVAGCTEPDKSLPWETRKQHTLDALKSASLGVKFVTCADKLHNLCAMLEEYRQMGDGMWKRFSRGQEKQRWYFAGLLVSLGSGPFGAQPLYQELSRAFAELFGRSE